MNRGRNGLQVEKKENQDKQSALKGEEVAKTEAENKGEET